MGIAPDVPFSVGQSAYGGYVAGIIDTTRPGSITAGDASSNGLRYVLIVSPKSLEHAGKQWQTAQTSAPPAAKTRWNGLAATAAMNSSSYPAAQYCAGLSRPADKASDWYLPAMDELELIYRNLKPTTESNQTGSRAGGTFPGTTGSHGQNIASDPTGAAYTTTNPAQTAVPSFRSSGGQSLDTAGQQYWASTEYGSTAGWSQHAASFPGAQYGYLKTESHPVRPVRRILVSDINAAPNAPTLTAPANGATIDRNSTQRFALTPSDPDPGDSTSQTFWRYRLIGAPSWTTVTQTSPLTYIDLAAGTFAAGDYEWQAATRDAQGAPTNDADLKWSTSSFFTAADAPAAPTITAPINGGTVSSSETVTWSAPNADAYELRRVRDNAGTADTATVYYDTGEVVTTTARSRSVTFETNNRYEHVQVRIKVGGLWSSWASVRVNVSYTPPTVPVVTLTPDAATGSLLVGITNPAPGAGVPATSYNDVYVDDGDGKERRATMLAPNSTWTYWTPKSGRDYDGAIRVVAVGSNGTTASS